MQYAINVNNNVFKQIPLTMILNNRIKIFVDTFYPSLKNIEVVKPPPGIVTISQICHSTIKLIKYLTRILFSPHIMRSLHLWKNLFKLPSGKAVKLFITELTTWLHHYNQESQFHGIVLKVFMVLPAMIMKTPSKSSKAKEHLIKLDEGLKLWKDGRISDLMRECGVVHKHLLNSTKREPKDTALVFSNLMILGKINVELWPSS